MVVVLVWYLLLVYKCIFFDELLCYLLVLCDLKVCEGIVRYFDWILCWLDMELLVVEWVVICDLMLVLVLVGFVFGFVGVVCIVVNFDFGVVVWLLVLCIFLLMIYLLCFEGELFDVLVWFIECV